ncbi:TetR/AcrR family transcriptional regulator [Streptomyces sp. NPDC088116]|uniref:TetR/AcrR family transcriptional regulator n=1 Tax=Streptomyces sp. NPDC088116 TaxID=3365825 RepID=UPI003804AAC9
MPTAREALLNAALSALTDLPWSTVRMVDVASAAGVSRQTLYNEFGSKDGLARALARREADLYLHGVERLLGERADPVDRLVAVAEWTVGRAAARPLLRALLTGCWGEWLPTPQPVRATAAPAGSPAQRRADAGPPESAELVALVRDRSAAALYRSRTEADREEADRKETGRTEPKGAGRTEAGRTEVSRVDPDRTGVGLDASGRADPGRPDPARPAHGNAELLHRCELAIRLALAHLIAPGGESVGRLVRTAVTAPLTVPPPAANLSAPSPRAGAR